MPHVSTETKHAILLEYAPHAPSRTFAALAARHSVKGGWRVLQRWHQQWDGTARSLQRKAGSGKQRLLNRAQISRHVRAPILAANRSHRAISYTQLLPAVQAKTGVELSVRTLRRYGKEEHGAKHKHTKKRTAAESECIATSDRLHASASVERCS